MIGLVAYDRVFAADTPATNEKARKVMVGVYALLLLVGAAFLVRSLSGPEVSPRTLVQAVIMLALGGGGMAVSLRRKVRPSISVS